MTTKPAKSTILSPWKLAKASWLEYRAGFKDFALVVLLVTIPVNMLSLGMSNDASFSAYSSFASVIMNLALIYTVIQHVNGSRHVTLRQAYYDGTAPLVRFMLVGLVVVLALIPAIIGLFIYSIEQSAATLAGSSLIQQLIVGLIVLIFAIPSIWLVTRWAFALVIVVDEDARPIAALKSSRRRTLGRFWRTFGRLAFLGLVMLVIAVVLVVPPAVFAGFFPGMSFVTLIFQTLFTVVGLPFANIYLVLLSRELLKDARS